MGESFEVPGLGVWKSHAQASVKIQKEEDMDPDKKAPCSVMRI